MLLPFVIYDIMNIWRKRMTRLINELMSDEAVYRTAPATPSLLKSYWQENILLRPGNYEGFNDRF